jgi:hypothetical protein
MKKSYFLLCFVLIVTFSMVLPSCINIERKIKINPDGSGTEKITIDYGKEFFDMMIGLISSFDSTRLKNFSDSLYDDNIFASQTAEGINKAKGLKLINVFSKTNTDSSKTVVTEYEFENVKYITNSFEKDEEAYNPLNIGITEVSYKTEGDKAIFRYYFKSSEPKDTTSSVPDLSEYFKDRKLIFKIEFPYEVVSSNAKYTNGNNLVWEFNMSDIYSKTSEVNLEAVMKK